MGRGAGDTVMTGFFLMVVVGVGIGAAGCSSGHSNPATVAEASTSGPARNVPLVTGSPVPTPVPTPAATPTPAPTPKSAPATAPELLTWKEVRPGVDLAGDAAAFAARFDPAALRFVLHAGSQVPGGSGWLDSDAAPAEGLVAGWNGGFLMANNASSGGFYLGGRTAYGPLRAGTASEVFYKNGSMDVVAWPGGAPGPDVLGVRQNLGLMIDGGRLAANLDRGTAADEKTWGFTNDSSNVHGNRSGVGVRADGRIVYAAVRGASPLQLAQYLQKAGAVRAMELDINLARPIFGTYADGRWSQPAPWLGPASRFTGGNERDFVVVYGR